MMKFLQPKNTQGSPNRVIALKLPYTCKTIVLEKHLKISKLQKYIENQCPALCRASLRRFVIANLRTKNIRDSAKYQLLKPQVKINAHLSIDASISFWSNRYS